MGGGGEEENRSKTFTYISHGVSTIRTLFPTTRPPYGLSNISHIRNEGIFTDDGLDFQSVGNSARPDSGYLIAEYLATAGDTEVNIRLGTGYLTEYPDGYRISGLRYSIAHIAC